MRAINAFEVAMIGKFGVKRYFAGLIPFRMLKLGGQVIHVLVIHSLLQLMLTLYCKMYSEAISKITW